MRATSTTAVLAALRRNMTKHALAAYLVPSCDAHNSEYLADRDKRRAFISGFTGSAGVAVILQEKALVWTDGRYHLQAAAEIDENWTLMRDGVEGTPTKEAWLAENVSAGSAVGVDPSLLSVSEWGTLKARLDLATVALKPITQNLVDLVWAGEQPDYPENPVVPLDLAFAGEAWEDKVARCRAKMIEKKVDLLVLTELDEVAWLLNLRGSDIDFNPIFFAYAAVTKNQVHLFISDRQGSSAQVRKHLKAVEIYEYSGISRFLEDQAKAEKRCWFGRTASYGLTSIVPDRQRVVEQSPVALMKGIKNEVEIGGFINCHVRDAAALCMYFAWLEKNAGSGKIDEITGATELERLRSRMEHYMGLSFETISASGPNAAVIHYRPAQETCRMVTQEEMYLVDSGGQYKDGTTDVTRTLHFGTPTPQEKECFTRVLKGQISLARMVFPNKVLGHRLDSFARASLWEVGLDYLHGTGHGVGAYLCVHEGPSGISYRPRPDDPGLQENMIMSNEPGYYEDGKFGIRIENLVRIVPTKTKYNFQDKGFLTFENLTVVPVQAKMIDPSLLTAEEIEYLNAYHETCRDRVGPLLREMGEQEGLAWLIRETEPIG